MATKKIQEKTTVKRPSDKVKVAVYEDFLHSVQMHCDVTMNNEQVRELLSRVCAWSYAHRSGNGERSEKDQNAAIDAAFWKLDVYKRHQ